MPAKNSFFLPRTLPAKLSAGVGLLALADFFFYKHPLGWTAGCYAAVMLAVTCILHRKTLKYRANQVIVALLCTVVLEMLESPNPISICLYVLGMFTLVVRNKRQAMPDFTLWLRDIFLLIERLLIQWNLDLSRLKALRLKLKIPQVRFGKRFVYVVVPTVFLAVFIYLFSQANPLIAETLAKLDWNFLFGWFSGWRLLFWCWSAILLWGWMRPRFKPATPLAKKGSINLDAWLSRNSIVISLLLFNAVFAIQNALDAAFLWRGAPLPEGIGYAQYARDGAYPLIFTALLAGVYVLVTFNGEKYQSAAARWLVGLWTAQNIFLVISAIDRTLNLIEVYSLTYLRLAALIWMGLVALGLFLITLRIFINRSNSWLLNSNALALTAVLYTCCFVNFNSIIANYNVRHSLEVTAAGHSLDLDYLESLGPDVIPALRWHASLGRRDTAIIAQELADGLRVQTESDWRYWTFRRWRILQGDMPQVTGPIYKPAH